jgi:hypothetical protein
LSAPQLETVVYSCQRHEEFDISGVRKGCRHLLFSVSSSLGFFLGDGAGVGKGRQLAGIILENWLHGRMKHVWFSVSSDLRLDARRDLVCQ